MSGYVRTEYPKWSWSFSRRQIFQACPRRYYYNYYGSHNGWEPNAPQEAALAYRLKKLTNIYLTLGNALHQTAERLALRVAEGRQPFSASEAEEMIRRQLRRVWRSSRDQRRLFLQRPNRVDMLHEFYYGRGLSEDVVELINQRAKQVAAALTTSATWEELAAKGSKLIAAEQFDTFELRGTSVYAVPDLLFRTEKGFWLIVDWKTGELALENQEQLALYALYVLQKHGVKPEKIKARLEYLSLAEVLELSFSRQELELVAEKAFQSMEEMRGFLADPELNAPKSPAHFPLTNQRRQCPSCNFYELCREELKQDPAPPEVS